jgi:HrpA-like RNA helicase
MILAAREHNCLREVLIIAAALGTQDPRDRPQEHAPAADQAHAKWKDEKSEFLSYLKLWAAGDEGLEARDQQQAAPVVPAELHQLAAPARVARRAWPADDPVPRARLEGEPDSRLPTRRSTRPC